MKLIIPHPRRIGKVGLALFFLLGNCLLPAALPDIRSIEKYV